MFYQDSSNPPILQNSKNRLQELCQQNRIALPIYNTYLTQNGFRSCVSIRFGNEKVIKSEGTDTSKKKEAEKKAAHNLLIKLAQQKQNNIQNIKNDRLTDGKYIAVYLDMENINVKKLKILFEMHKYDPLQYLFVGCLSGGHHHAQTVFQFKDISFEKLLVPSTRSDAADIGMIMHALIQHSGKAVQIVFVSGDKFSCVFVELSQKGFCVDSEKTKFDHCSNIEEMKLLLTK